MDRFVGTTEEDKKFLACWDKIHGPKSQASGGDGSGSAKGASVSYRDAYDLAVRTGQNLASAFASVTGELPEHIDKEFAEGLIRDALKADYDIVSKSAAAVQKRLNEQAGLGLNAVTAPFDEERAEGLITKFAEYDDVKDAEWLLGEPVVNFSQHIVDDTVKQNAEFQSKAGLRPKIVRKAHGKVCKWCAAKAGTYNYPGEVPADVYKRHENCRCTVEYDPGSGKRVQDIWTKRWTAAEESDKIEERMKIEGITGSSVRAGGTGGGFLPPIPPGGGEGHTPTPPGGGDDSDAKKFLYDLAEHPKKLGTYTPKSLKKALEEKGCDVKPLSDGNFQDVSFEDGGGYKTNFGGDGLLMYHPEERSHHGGAYYKISTGKKGIKHYDLNGDELKPTGDI